MFAENTRANLAAVGIVTPRTSTVHVPTSGVWTSTCSTLLIPSYVASAGFDHPFRYRFPWYSAPLGDRTRRSRFRDSASPVASTHTRVTFTGTSSRTTLRFMPAGLHVPVVKNSPIANWFARGTGGKRDCSRSMRPHPWSYPGYAYKLLSIRTAPLIRIALTSCDGGLKNGEPGLLPPATSRRYSRTRMAPPVT